MFELRVLTGLHRGAALPLTGQEWHIGSEENADLALFDPGIKARHCILKLEGTSTGSQWTLTSEQGSIANEAGEKVQEITALAVGSPFSLNGVWLSVSPLSAPWPEEQADDRQAGGRQAVGRQTKDDFAGEALISDIRIHNSQPSAPVALYVFGFIGIITVAVILATTTWASVTSSMSSDSTTVYTEKKHTEQNNDEDSLLSQIRSQEGNKVLHSSREVKQTLQSMLRERDLDKNTELKALQHKVLLTGGLNPDEQARVERMLIRFRSHYETDIAIDNLISDTSTELPFKIIQIIASPTGGHLVTNKGQQMFVGDEVQGIRLVAIEQNKILFKGERSYEILW